MYKEKDDEEEHADEVKTENVVHLVRQEDLLECNC